MLTRSSLLRSAAALILAASFAGSAMADQATSTFNVTARTQGNCEVAAENLAFGDYTPGAGSIDSESSISVRCTNGTSYSIALDAGATAGGSINQRLMSDGANQLEYNLFTDASRTTVWGDGSSGATPSGTGAGMSSANTQVKTVYGRLPDSLTNQNVAPGDYSDVITVTVTF